jgi:hypothetical protein
VQSIVDILPVDGARAMLMGERQGAALRRRQQFSTVLTFEDLQNELAEGPCLEAYRFGLPVSIQDLGGHHPITTVSCAGAVRHRHDGERAEPPESAQPDDPPAT